MHATFDSSVKSLMPPPSKPDNPFDDFLASPPLESSNQLAANARPSHGMNDPFADAPSGHKKPVKNAYDMDSFFDELVSMLLLSASNSKMLC